MIVPFSNADEWTASPAFPRSEAAHTGDPFQNNLSPDDQSDSPPFITFNSRDHIWRRILHSHQRPLLCNSMGRIWPSRYHSRHAKPIISPMHRWRNSVWYHCRPWRSIRHCCVRCNHIKRQMEKNYCVCIRCEIGVHIPRLGITHVWNHCCEASVVHGQLHCLRNHVFKQEVLELFPCVPQWYEVQNLVSRRQSELDERVLV